MSSPLHRLLLSAAHFMYRIACIWIGTFLLCVSFSATAQDGTYVGAYTSYYFGGDISFRDETSALQYVLDIRNQTKNYGQCGDSYIDGKNGVWTTDTVVNNIAIRQYRTYGFSYNWGSDGRCDRVEESTAVMYRSRLVCQEANGQRYFAPAGVCRDGGYAEKEDANGGNVGPQCPNCTVGKPITPATGNMWHVITDYQPAKSGSDLTLSRIYNSSFSLTDPFGSKGFGRRWSHVYSKSIKPELPFSENNKNKCWRFVTGEWDCTWHLDTKLIPQQISVKHADGKRFPYVRDSSGIYFSTSNVNDKISPLMSPDNLAILEWILYSANDDRTEHFSRDGRLLSITERSGLTQKLTYSDGLTNDTAVSRFPASAPACKSNSPDPVVPEGRLLCVTNHWGSQLQFKYDAKGRIVEMTDPAGQSYLYEYDGPSGGCLPGNEKTLACKANNLTRVTYPDGKNQTYFYNEVSKINSGRLCHSQPIGNGFGEEMYINLMTGLVDENEERHMSWKYDCSGRATSSEVADGIEKVEVLYADGASASATVTHYVGPAEKPTTTVRTYGKTYVQGIAKPTTIDAPCVECGTIAERTYDSIGNVTKTKDFNSNFSCFAYNNVRNLEITRVEGVAGVDCTPLLTAQTLALPARKVTTKWHAQFRLAEVIAEPKRITNYKYDASGNLTSKTEQATTDLTGALGLSAPVTGSARTWTYTYSNVGQLKTVTGPRTDLVDRTTYDYDPSTGDLITVTNAAKQTTTFSDYDAHGHVRTIRAPNGVTTKLSYTPRGWVASQSISNGTSTQTTSYDYTPSGQVKTVTLPDNSVTTYNYDVAQRLTSIANNRGESITYTLDLTGNRIKEEVRDPNGNLARQITRTYDITGRLTSQTGAAQ